MLVVEWHVNLYADDSMIYFSHKNPQEVKEVLERELEVIVVWIEQNKLRMNAVKTQLNRKHRQMRLRSSLYSIVENV